jgi:nucleoside-diphosphate-sugar epimerase
MDRPLISNSSTCRKRFAIKYQYFTQGDISKIREAGYDEKTIPLEDAVTDYVRNYLMKDAYLKG